MSGCCFGFESAPTAPIVPSFITSVSNTNSIQLGVLAGNLTSDLIVDPNPLNVISVSPSGTIVQLSGKNISLFTNDVGYITGNQNITISGEASGSGATNIVLTLDNTSVTSKVLTGLNIIGSSITAADSILSAFGKVQNQINGLLGGAIYQGVWNANTNVPALTSGVGTKGYYYVVNVAGTTNLDGITDWKVGDWAIFNGTTWDKVDNTDAVSSVNGFIGAVNLTTTNIPEGTQLYYTNSRGIGSVLTGYVSGAGVVSATDTILQAIQKLNGNITAIPSYTFSTGLTNTSNTITSNLSTGITGGQSIIGGTGVSDVLTIKGTTGNGTSTVASIVLTVGNNGATTALQALNSGYIVFPASSSSSRLTIREWTAASGYHALYFGAAVAGNGNFGIMGTSTATVVNGSSNLNLQIGGGDYLTFTSGQLQVNNNATTFLVNSPLINFAPGTRSSGSSTSLLFTAAASTNQTASTEVITARFNMSAAIEHATGAITTQRDFVIDARTHTAVAASTITTAGTLVITAAPIAGTNVTITNPYAFWIQSGNALIQSGNLVMQSGIINITSPTASATGGFITTSNTTITGANSQNPTGFATLHSGSGYGSSIYYGLGVQNRSTSALSAGMGVGILMGLGYGGGSFINTKITSYAIGAVSSSLDSAFGIQTSIGGTVAERFTFYKESFGINTTTPNSYLQVNGSFATAYVAKTSNYTVTSSDYTINCTSGTFNITLLTAVGVTGRIYVIKNSGVGTITVDTTSSQTIDGSLTQVLSAGSSIWVQSNGTNWIILA